MFDRLIKQNMGVLIKVIPNHLNDNQSIDQLIALIHDISDDKLEQISKQRKPIKSFKHLKEHFKLLYNILTMHPNVISYEIYSDTNETCFNFWIPLHLSKLFVKQIYSIWPGGDVEILEKDYMDFNIEKTSFASIRFASHSIVPLDVNVDILKQLINHLDGLDIDEKVLLQFLMKPAKKSWNEGANVLVRRIKEGKHISNSRISNFINNTMSDNQLLGSNYQDVNELMPTKVKINRTLSKLSKNGIQVNIRMAAQSSSNERSRNLINGLVNVLKIMEGNDNSFNKFVRRDLLPIQNKEKFYKYMEERRLPIVTLNQKDVWVTDEIANFLRLPTVEIESNKIKRVYVRQTHVDDSVTTESKLRMGYHTISGKKRPIYWNLSDMDTLMRPVVVIANPGEGKTEMLKNKFLDWIHLGYGAAVLDVSDGKLADEILYLLPEDQKDRVILIDCNDLLLPPGLSNFSEARDGDRSTNHLLSQLWTEFYINFFGIDDHHRSKDFIRKSSVPIFFFEENTILEQYLMIKSEEFRASFLNKIKDVKRLYKYWLWWNSFNQRPYKVKAEEVKAILNKFDVIMDNDILKNIICQRESKIPKFRDLMDQSKIIIIKAGEGAIYYEASRIIGALTLMKFWMAALSRYKENVNDRKPFKIFCDEPQNYIASGDYIKEMMAKSRKYRLGLEFYFQDPAQIEEKDKYLLKLMVSMNPHLVLGKMGVDEYKKYFKDRIFPIQPKEGFSLPKYHWIVSMYSDKTNIPPFIMEAVEMLPDPDQSIVENRKMWIYGMKKKYGTPVDIVEDDILKRELIGFEEEFDEMDEHVTIRGNATSI